MNGGRRIFTRLLSCFAVAVVALSSANAQDGLPKSRALLEQKVLELKEEARQAASQIQELTQLLANARQAEQCASTLSAPGAGETEALTAVRSAWEKIVALRPTTILDRGQPEYDALDSAYRSATGARRPFESCLQTLQPAQSEFDRLLAREESRTSPRVRALVTQYVGRFRDRQFGQRDEIGAFLFDFQGEGWPRSRLQQAQIARVTSSIESLKQRGSDFSQRLTEFRTALRDLVAATEREIAATKSRSEEIDRRLIELDERLSTGTAATDKQLIVAVYLMIGALLVLFLGVKLLAPEIAMKIIENRSLVEVVSMAFLLLTIIILGTGEKMPKEAIGTLLGSIAGYIFGRKISDSK